MDINSIMTVAIETLQSDERNARVHGERNLQEVMRSLEKFGQHSPLVVQRGTNRVLVGNGRLEAMKRLGWKEAAVYFVDDDDAQAALRALADNRTGDLSAWNETMLGNLLREFDAADVVGWNESELKALLTEDAGPVSDDDFDPTPPKKPTTILGDVYQLGRHRLVCGDSTNVDHIEKLMRGEHAQFVFTDPPWNVDYGASKHPSWKTGKDRQIMNDAMSTEDFGGFLKAAFANLWDILDPGAMLYVVMSAQEWGNIMDVMTALNYHWSSTIIWNKDRLVLSRKDYHTKYEPIWYGWKDGSRLYPLKDRTQTDVWDVDRPSRSDEHPTMKPVELVAKALRNSSAAGDVAVDLFGGSGTTMIACEQLGRKCRMMELDPKYCDVIIRRWENYTGEKAVRDA